MGCCQAFCGLRAADTMTTALAIAAVIASSGRPIKVTARTLTPMSTARAHGWKGRNIK